MKQHEITKLPPKWNTAQLLAELKAIDPEAEIEALHGEVNVRRNGTEEIQPPAARIRSKASHAEIAAVVAAHAPEKDDHEAHQVEQRAALREQILDAIPELRALLDRGGPGK